MNKSELAGKILLWEEKKTELDNLEDEIKQEVLTLKLSQKVGNVSVSYTNGRRELDYETPGKLAPAEIIKNNTTINSFVDWEEVSTLIDPDIIVECTKETETVNWSNVCKEAKIEADVIKEGIPAVSIKRGK